MDIENNKKKKEKEIERIVFEDLEGKFLVIRVGTEEKPARTEDINDIETKLNKLLEDNKVNCIAFVTHHAVDIELIEKAR
jgi:hypothetical protein